MQRDLGQSRDTVQTGTAAVAVLRALRVAYQPIQILCLSY
jgi:hypothetical protein